MYPPRSGRKRSKTTGKRRKNKIWAGVNIGMFALIIMMLFGWFYGSGGDRGSAPPPGSVTASPPPATATGPSGDPQAPGQASIAPSPSGELPPPVADGPSPGVDIESPPSGASAAPRYSPAADTGPSPTPEEGAGNAEASAPASPKAPESGSGSGGKAAGLPPGQEGSGGTVTLNFAGDVIFAGKVGELLKQKGYDYPYAKLDGLFLRDDLSVVNLETPVTLRGTQANKTFVFKSPPEALDALKAAGVDAVNLANNHTLDMGEQGLRDTLDYLDDKGIPFVGAGLDSGQAYAAQYFKRNGMTIALLGFTRVMPEAGWAAGKNKPGLASVYDSGAALRAIAEARKKADIVAVVVHWGQERVNEPNAVQQSLGRSFIDAGADLVIGGHPHVLQGLEPYKGKWIAYSTGNFIFTRSVVKTTWETAVFQAECNAEGQCSMKLAPFDAELGQPVPMSAGDGQKLLKRVESLSSGKVRIDEEGRVTDAGK